MTPIIYMILPVLATLAYGAYLIWLVRSEKLKEKYISYHLLLFVALLVFSLAPTSADAISRALGFHVTANFLLAGGVFVLLMISVSLAKNLSKSEERIRRLAEEVALLREMVEGTSANSQQTDSPEEESL